MDIRKIVPSLPAAKGEFVAVDVEMYDQDEDNLHIAHGEFACLSIAYSGGVYQLTSPELAEHALKILRDGMWVMHNATYDLTQLRRYFNIQPRKVWDTLLVEHALWGGYYNFFGLDDLARRYLDVKLDKEVRSSFAKQRTYMTKQQSEYAAKDAVVTLAVADEQKKLLTPETEKMYWNVDAPMIWAVLDMQPIKVDVPGWHALVKQFDEEATKRQDELGFNVKSPKQVKEAAKRIANVNLKDTKAKTLESFVDFHPLFKSIIDCRAYRTAISFFGENWLTKNVREGDLVRPSWKITGAETGRMASSSPNVQQIPSRNVELGMDRYRNLFISKYDDGELLVADINQQEPRILAYASQDPMLIEALTKGEDLHLRVAKEIFNDPKLTKKDSGKRSLGKAINLGLAYGLTAGGLARNTGMPEHEAQHLLDNYFNRFKGVAAWISLQRNQAQNNEYVTTAGGRRVWVNLYSGQWENNAINGPIQGGAADHTKLTVGLLWKECRARRVDFPLTMIVHDEIILDIHRGDREMYEKMVNDAWLEAARRLFAPIPFKVDIAHGKNWNCKKES